MTDQSFKLLFSPIQVGKLTLRNRIVFLPHTNMFVQDQLPGEREVYYFGERAKGGVALIIFAAQLVHPSGGIPMVNATNPKVVERYKRITDMVHQHGAYMSAQLMHRGGSQAYSEEGLNEWTIPYGPSKRPWDGTMCREMDHDGIQRTLEAYRLAAKHVKEGGFDGIQVRLNHGLPEEFLSELSNHRTDEYGGSLENRLRLGQEMIAQVRDEVGPDMIMDVRLCADQAMPEGYGVETGQEIARMLAATGNLDFITTSVGGVGSEIGGAYIQGPYPLPQGFGVEAAAALKKAVDIPVVAQGRINDPIQAEQILATGQGDMVGLARGLIADPEFANKAKEGRPDDIRKCFAYHEVCQGRNGKRRPITCVHNPSAGREKELGIGTLKPASVKKKVMVIGGGPAGLKTAEVAARRGHQVSLYDKADQLGGQLNLAIRLPYRDHLGEVVSHLTHQVEKLGVEVHTGVEVTTEMVSEASPDTVVVATGALPFIPSIPGADQDNVVTYWDVARDRGVTGDSVVIYDIDGFWAAPAIAELLASQGKKVHIVTPFKFVGADIFPLTLMLWEQRVDGKGIARSPDSDIKAISGNKVTIHNPAWGGDERTIQGVDTVVLACGATQNDSLYTALLGKVKDLRMVGDCEAPLRVERGIYAAEILARAL